MNQAALPSGAEQVDAATNFASAKQAFQNHEERLGTLEELAHHVLAANPTWADSLGRPRVPHNFTFDEQSPLPQHNIDTEAFMASLAKRQADYEQQNAATQAILSAILDRLGQSGQGQLPPSTPTDYPAAGGG